MRDLKVTPKVAVYAAAVLALIIGFVAYGNLEEEHDHDEHSLLAVETDKMIVAGAVLGGVCVISAIYLWKKGPSEGSENDV